MTVYEAWSNVMEEVQAIGKDGVNTTPGQNYKFRGIEAVMNAVGPVLRRHKVVVVPKVLEESAERYQTKSGTAMINRVVRVRFTVYGPDGDSFDGETYGEAADSSDKSISKAQSVAYRTFLTQALTIPTGDADPDASTHERSFGGARVKPVEDVTAALKALKAAADRAGVSKEGVESYLQEKFNTGLSGVTLAQAVSATEHFTELAVKKELKV